MMSEEMITMQEGHVLPALALRGLTVFPNMMVHFDVARELSMKALERAMDSGEDVFLVTQRALNVEAPERKDLYNVGTICSIRQLLRLPDNNIRVMVEGHVRARLLELVSTKPFLLANVEPAEQEVERGTDSPKAEAVIRQTYELFERYGELSERFSPELILNVFTSRDSGYIADYIAQNIPIRSEDKQTVLNELRPVRRLERMNQILAREIQVLTMERDLDGKIRDHMNQAQREYYLREQMKVIQSELGDTGGEDEILEYQERIRKAKLPETVEEKLKKELRRLEKQPFGSAEAAVSRNYLDVCLEIPWTKKTKERVNVEAARKILEADHYGLDKVKQRILEFLAVKQLEPELRGQIICLYGPPGVGKTSVASSIARATNRKLARVSLGGIHDEAEIRGHRKTYIGAMPGRIITAITKAGTANPLILLDEIDKLGADQRSDPASALLEVLDSEQNSTFRDHFLELPFDLSDVMFITTANDLSTVPRPLLDRMEVIELSSYTDEEKVQIAKRHLLPKQLKRHGMKSSQLRVTDAALREIISGYTRESGVRQLERKLSELCRKAAMRLVSEEDCKRVTVNGDELETLLGPRRYHPERLARTPQVGLVNGLAWTSVGGELLEVEVNVMPGTGKVEATGNLGKVMEESCHSALSYIRAHAQALGVEADFYKTKDIHVHFPEAATPKDGPSAGITITTAMVSALTGARVRCGIAMTGEVTLRGRVLPIGGLKEKTMAAFRNGIQTVIIPGENERDLEEIDQTVRSALHFVTVDQVDQVLAEALEPLGTGAVQEQGLEMVPVNQPVSQGSAIRQ